MDDILFRLLLGHGYGDYVLQNNWMALNKKNRALPLLVHSTIYTLVIKLAVPEFTFPSLALIWIFHVLVDGSRVVDDWFWLIGGRSFSVLKKQFASPTPCIQGENSVDIYKQSMTSLTWFVQIVTDNLWHIAWAYIVLKDLNF